MPPVATAPCFAVRKPADVVYRLSDYIVAGIVKDSLYESFGEGPRPCFRVSHCRRRVAVDGSEVPLAFDQGVAHVEFLREADQRVVDRRVAVRVIVAHHLADDLRALAIGPVRREPHRAHAVEDAAVRRLQPVAHVWQRPSDDYAHRVIHVRALHFVFDVDWKAREGCVGHENW